MKGHPAWYGSVMGTGALALALSVQSLTWQADWLRWGAQGFLVVASVLAIVLLPPYAARLRSREALTGQGVACQRVLLIGGGAQSPAVGRIASEVFGTPVVVPQPGEYVAAGAARQAAWALTGELPDWDATDCPGVRPARIYEGEPRPEVLERYAAVQAAAYN